MGVKKVSAAEALMCRESVINYVINATNGKDECHGLQKAFDETCSQEDEQLPLEEDPKIVSTYFPHSVSHFLGLDVHDVGNKKHKFEPGMLLTCEPGIYIKEENIGIRLENDILITEDGHLDLMAHIPITSEEIENLLDQ